MKIGILTFHCAANYGAILQSYALQETLKKLGHEVFILDYRPMFLISPYKAFNIRRKSFKELIRAFLVTPKRYKRLCQFRKFEKENLNLCPFEDYDSMDAIVVGSDQVWSSVLNYGNFDRTYFLDFPLNSHIRRISYAASAGSSEQFEKALDRGILDNIKNFESISVREKSLGQVLKKHIPTVDPVEVLDPVLMAGKEPFMRFIDKTLVPNQKYVLAFFLGYNPEIAEYGQLIATRHNAILINIASMSESFGHGIRETLSIPQFLSLIYFAEHIVTPSFHGTAFSILFQKSFTSVGLSKEHSERSRSLLKKIGLEDNFVLLSKSTEETGQIQDIKNISDESINLLNDLASKSQSFLKSNLS